MVWEEEEAVVNSFHNVDCSPVLHDIECLSQVNSFVHNCDKIHIFGRSYGAISLMKKSMLKRCASSVQKKDDLIWGTLEVV